MTHALIALIVLACGNAKDSTGDEANDSGAGGDGGALNDGGGTDEGGSEGGGTDGGSSDGGSTDCEVLTWWLDNDKDGYGDPATSTDDCEAPAGHVDNDLDCDDDDETTWPGASDGWYDGVDSDCGGEDDFDQDRDGYVPDAYTGLATDGVPGSGERPAGDCDDVDPSVNPGVDEICDDGLDNNCDGQTDADDATCFRWGDNRLADADLQFTGESEGDRSGGAISSAGDVDADGYDDILVAAGGYYSSLGAAYLIRGGPSLASSSLADADARYTGDSGDYAGNAVAGAGDINRDGYADLLIGASSAPLSTNEGSIFVILGGPKPASMSLESADALISGARASDRAGSAVSGAGDVNGDGFDDMLIGAQYVHGHAASSGAAYLVLGRRTPGSISLSRADGSFSGEAYADYAGGSVAGAGDVDGDGLHDLLIGASHADASRTDSGAAYVVLGSTALTSPSLSESDARFDGEGSSEYAGTAVAGANDVDGDGYDDMLVGAPYNDEAGSNAGSAYLVLGGLSLASMSLSLADATYTGENEDDFAGAAVAGAGDVDGDGQADILVGAPFCAEAGYRSGASYLVRGGPTPASLSLTDADARFVGESGGDYSGASVSSAGDVDANGWSDLLIAAYLRDDGPRSEEAGVTYLILGGR